MNLILPYITSASIGFLVIIQLFKDKPKPNFYFMFFLAIGLGLGISSSLTFYSFFLKNGFSVPLIWSAHILILLSLLFLHKASIINFFKNPLKIDRNISPDIYIINIFFHLMVFLSFIIISKVIYDIAFIHPLGEWDALTVWNLKTKYFLESGNLWKNCFLLNEHTNPDYPALLPFMNVWGATFAKNNTNSIPLITGVIFTVSCGGLLFGGLKQDTHPCFALIPMGLLLLLPPFIFFGTSQYADIVLAFYLLASVLCLIQTFKNKEPQTVWLSGLFLGFASCTKNEGLFIAFILFVLSALHIFFIKNTNKTFHKKLIVFLFLGWFFASLPTIFLKFFLLPPTKTQLIFNFSYLNKQGLLQILQAIFKIISDTRYHFLWFLFLLMFLGNPTKYFYKESKIVSYFFICYFFLILFVYLFFYPSVYGTFGITLTWLLRTTLPRIILTQIPLLLYLNFYVYFNER